MCTCVACIMGVCKLKKRTKNEKKHMLSCDKKDRKFSMVACLCPMPTAACDDVFWDKIYAIDTD